MTDNSDDFMKASAEEWSKPEKPEESADDFSKASAEEWSEPEVIVPAEPTQKIPTDRRGAPVATPENTDPNRWGPERMDTSSEPKIIDAELSQTEKKKRFPWWAIVIIVLVVLCLCIVGAVLVIFSIITPSS
jgi:hypothetical protein